MKIALTGKSRTGKDTIAYYASQKHNMVRFAFGDELKSSFHKEYPHIPEDPKPVRGYQLYGQLMRFVKSDTIWIDKCFDRIAYVNTVAKAYKGDNNSEDISPIITDLRQYNELERCREEGYTIIGIHTPFGERVNRMAELSDDVSMNDLKFETETELEGFDVDFDINNDGTLENLYEQFDNIVNILKKS